MKRENGLVARGAASSYAGGFVGTLALGGSLSDANQAGLNAMPMGAGLGAAMGGFGGYRYAKKHNLNMWDGKANPQKVIKENTPPSKRVIKGFTKHGTNQAIERGFKTSDILKIIREGDAINAMGQFGPQTRYSLGGNTVVVNTQGKVISVFSNSINGENKGYFIPIK